VQAQRELEVNRASPLYGFYGRGPLLPCERPPDFSTSLARTYLQATRTA
jgi:hypothetical protein